MKFAWIPVKYVLLYPLFWLGYLYYQFTGRTLHLSYKSFRKLYALTDGRLNAVLGRWSASAHPKVELPRPTPGILGSMALTDVEAVSRDIQATGYHLFAQKLSPDACDRLVAFAKNTDATPVPRPSGSADKVRYDRSNLIAPRYNFDQQSLVENHQVQEIITDKTLLAVAQEYLECEPVLDLVTMWWSAAYRQEASSEAAQMYHFDMDRPKFLKFFFYLSDVTERTGPHCYVRGSHKSIPEALRVNRRITDPEINANYADSEILEFVGKKGTILAVDTSGLHKGKALQTGERLIFQLEFSNNLFGAPYEKVEVNRSFPQGFSRLVEQYPYTYQLFRIP